jgi:hypoxanthine phosphoribosyltransferase
LKIAFGKVEDMTDQRNSISVCLAGETYFRQKERSVWFTYPDKFDASKIQVDVYYGKKREVYFAVSANYFIERIKNFADKIIEKQYEDKCSNLKNAIESLRKENEELRKQLKNK